MRGWGRRTLMPPLPRSLLTWSGVWATLIKPVLHHNIMLRNRVRARPPIARAPDHIVGMLTSGGAPICIAGRRCSAAPTCDAPCG